MHNLGANSLQVLYAKFQGWIQVWIGFQVQTQVKPQNPAKWESLLFRSILDSYM